MTTAGLVILVPVLRRPQSVAPLLESIHTSTASARVLFIGDPGDTAEHDAIARAGAEMIATGGNYAQKINTGVRHTTEPYLFAGADDLRFHPGWLEAALEVMERTGAGLVGTQDLCNARVIAGEHATHFLLARWYAQLPTIDGQPGPCFEGYEHEFVDDELIGTARERGAYAFAPGAIVEHLHPDVGKAPTDALYAAQGARMRRSRPLFQSRTPLWTSRSSSAPSGSRPTPTWR